jgi:hypothetical protein
MPLPKPRRELLERPARSSEGRVVGLRVATDPESGRHVLCCVDEYAAGLPPGIGAPRTVAFRLHQAADRAALWRTAKALAERYGIPLLDAP